MGLLILIAVVFIIILIVWLSSIISKANKYTNLKPKLDGLNAYEERLRAKEWDVVNERDKFSKDMQKAKMQWNERVRKDIEAIEFIAKQKSTGFPWLANAYAEFYELKDLKDAEYLERKSHPAFKAAEKVRELSGKKRIAEYLYRLTKYQLIYYENLFPWLIEFKDENIDDAIIKIMERRNAVEISPEEDPVRIWLTSAEYQNLSTCKRNQLALDRYWKKPKTKWEIGRDYERYNGYLYESRGYKVLYFGILEGFSDLGRDLIAVKDNEILIVQCKYWSRNKMIHEKHVFQLYGTLIAYMIDNNIQRPLLDQGKQLALFKSSTNITGYLVTSTILSERAKLFANALDIKFIENMPLDQYPCIKCNISRRTKEKIYHLPFDQQYDTTIIEKERGECYVVTVKEAEDAGFRRAFRWTGDAND